MASAVAAAAAPAAAAAVKAAAKPSAARNTITAVVRRILAENDNQPMRVGDVWELARTRNAKLAGTKTYFKEHVILQMRARDEIVTEVFTLTSDKGKRSHYGFRLKCNATMRDRVAALGLTLRGVPPRMPGAQTAATKAAVNAAVAAAAALPPPPPAAAVSAAAPAMA